MEYGVNINGDRPVDMIKKGGLTAEKAGFDTIWVGEKPKFMHPFPVAAVLAHTTEKVQIGSGIISPLLNRCSHIAGGFKVLREAYGDRFIIGIAPGDKWALREVGVNVGKAATQIKECLKALKEQEFKVYLGASDPALARMGDAVADGLLINYVKPEYVKWALAKAGDKVKKAAYGPSLLLPDDDHSELLLVGAATVAAGTSMSFQREFGMEEWVKDIGYILRRRAYSELRDHRERLLESFTIHGEIDDITDRVVELRRLGVDGVIFGGPLSRNLLSVARLGNELRSL